MCNLLLIANITEIRDKTQEKLKKFVGDTISNLSIIKKINIQKDGDLALFSGIFFTKINSKHNILFLQLETTDSCVLFNDNDIDTIKNSYLIKVGDYFKDMMRKTVIFF